MNDRFPRKPTILSAAISTQLAVVELKGAERRAALQIPIKQAVRDLGRDLAKELDDNLQQAIERYLGRPIAQDADVVGRLTVQSDPNHTPAEERGETYAMDGEAILWAGPVKIEQFGDEGDEHMRCSRALRHYPHATQAAALRRNLLATMDSVKCLSDYDDTAAGAPENPPDQPA